MVPGVPLVTGLRVGMSRRRSVARDGGVNMRRGGGRGLVRQLRVARSGRAGGRVAGSVVARGVVSGSMVLATRVAGGMRGSAVMRGCRAVGMTSAVSSAVTATMASFTEARRAGQQGQAENRRRCEGQEAFHRGLRSRWKLSFQKNKPGGLRTLAINFGKMFSPNEKKSRRRATGGPLPLPKRLRARVRTIQVETGKPLRDRRLLRRCGDHDPAIGQRLFELLRPGLRHPRALQHDQAEILQRLQLGDGGVRDF
jgi:hypothetical protein